MFVLKLFGILRYIFSSREVIIDKKLYQECRKDASQLCGAEKNWHKSSLNPQYV